MSVVDKTYCEHYRGGLPFCAKCEADRAERNEQMHAQIAELERELAAARAEIAADEARLVAYVARVSGEIERKDKLIEQMREALEYALTEARSTECERLIEAALSAAERGE